jgi:hypothetical protein
MQGVRLQEHTRRTALKKLLLLSLGVAIGIGATQAMHNVFDAIERGKSKRFVVDALVLMSKLEKYQAEHAIYPVGCDPTTITSLFPEGTFPDSEKPWFQYCSDGERYVLALVPFGGGEYGPIGAPLVAANNEVIAWPVSGHAVVGGGKSPETHP